MTATSVGNDEPVLNATAVANSEKLKAGEDNECGWALEMIKANLHDKLEVLDVATGNGELARMLADHVGSVVALDLEASALSAAKESCEGVANITFKEVWTEETLRAFQLQHQVLPGIFFFSLPGSSPASSPPAPNLSAVEPTALILVCFCSFATSHLACAED